MHNAISVYMMNASCKHKHEFSGLALGHDGLSLIGARLVQLIDMYLQLDCFLDIFHHDKQFVVVLVGDDVLDDVRVVHCG